MSKSFPPGILGLEERSDLIARRVYKILESVLASQLTRRVEFAEKGLVQQVSVQLACSIVAGRLVLTAVIMGNERSDRTDIIYDSLGDFERKIAPHAINIIREDRKRMRQVFEFEESVNLLTGTMDNETDIKLLQESLSRIDKLVTMADIEDSRVVRKHTA
jgi:hypothetical protein